MLEPTPAVLLERPELVAEGAPWCTWLEGHELCILLLAQPWFAGQGRRRAELATELERLAADLPLGPIYFQRVSRSAIAMVERGQLRAQGRGRTQRYETSAEGLAALILNLQVLRADPTLDAREFELKRALVALWNLVGSRLADLPGDLDDGPELRRLRAGLAKLTVWGRPVITAAVIDAGFDLLGLVRTQRARVAALAAEARQRVEALNARYPLVAPPRARRPARRQPDAAEAVAQARAVAAGVGPRLEAEVALLRYQAYTGYLDQLMRLYAEELPVVDLGAMRRIFAGARR